MTDNVHKPAHYQGKVECIDAIESVRGVAYTTHDNDMVMTTKAVAIANIHKKFQ